MTEHNSTHAGHLFGPPPGTRVQEWLLQSPCGYGAYGVVYRAVRVGREAEGPVALKMALYPWDPRFMREVGLLSLIHHPSIPRMLGHGFWQNPKGLFFPFIIMEWVEGTRLYEWAREHAPTTWQVLQVLGQLAQALAATHATGAVHRDVKGDNVLVRRSDGRAMLMDFGAGNYPCTAKLTWQPLPPGTPPYQSPQAMLFERTATPSQEASYQANAADDVYALGVTAYRLVTGEYPPGHLLWQQPDGTWHLEEDPQPSPHERNPRVDPQLSAQILRMLFLAPEARGTAAELAEALEAAEARAAKEAGEPPGAQPSSQRLKPWMHLRNWQPVSAALLAGAVLILGLWHAVHARSERKPVASTSVPTDEAAAGLGESGAKVPWPPEPVSSQQKAVAQNEPPKPFLGQLTPDAKGRCPGRKQLPINGGCWVEQDSKDAEECEENGYVFFQARCYAPALDTRRKPPPTSAPSESR